MANAFNLTAQLNLRGPSNIRPIIGQMRKELGSLNADIKFSIDKGAVKSVDAIRGKVDGLNAALVAAKSNAKDLTAIFRDLQSSLSSTKGLNIGGGKSLATTAASAQTAAKNLKQTSSAIEEFGQKSALAFKRFAAYSIATTGIFALVNAVNQGVKAFIEFERRLIQLRQVTGSGAVGIAGLEKEITSLATTLGVSSDSLAQVAITLAQAGLSANETRIALAALAKTDLAPSFDNLTDTTEGAIAALRQFGLEAGDLESVLGSINAVAAKFAVESGDIIAAIQRTGGVFASASKGVTEGKDALNEFIAVFTSVRATTRESAETIATGLRTIFTRIQRAKTIDQLKEFGVNLQDLEGKFVGPFEAVKRLSEALNQLDPRDIRFATIVEELGGFRQIGKVIPLIQQFATAQEALKVAQQGAGSLAEDQVIAQQSLANQIAKVREQFLALIRDVGKSTTFQVITKTVLTLTSGLISLAGAFKPILPILGILGTIKGISAISQFATGFFGLAGKGGGGPDTGDTVAQAERERAEATNRASDVIRENTTAITGLTGAIQSLESSIKSRGSQTLNGGGKVLAFARGGVVPGSGNKDTVPAMLQPGEFVIRKKAVESLGAGNLQRMNKYAAGGYVKKKLPDAEQALAEQSISYGNISRLKINDSGKGAIRGYMFENYVGKKYKIPSPDQKFPDIPNLTDSLKTKFGLTKQETGKDITAAELKYRSGLEPNFNDEYTPENTAVLYAIERNKGGIINRFANGGIATAPLIDDINNATGTVQPRPGLAIQELIRAGGGAIDIDRTLKRTIGDKAYGSARTDSQRETALTKYFRDSTQRLEDVKSAPLTQFGQELKTAIESRQLDPNKLSIISKSQRVSGVAEYLHELFGIPVSNMVFTQGGSKQPALDALRTKGPRAERAQRFMNGGRALGARSKFKELSETEISQLSTADLISYGKALAYDIFSTGGAGIATSSEFVEVPQERIIPELEQYLVDYAGKKGFWREKISPFGQAIQQKQVQDKTGRQSALSSQISKQSDEVAARDQNWRAITDGSAIDSYLRSALQEPILSDYNTVREGGSLSKTFHNTRLRQAVNKALENYDDFDYSAANIDKLVTGLANKQFKYGGMVQKFMAGGIPSVVDKNKLLEEIDSLGGPQSVRGLLGIDRVNNAIRQSAAETTRLPTPKQIFSKSFLTSPESDPFIDTIDGLLKDAKLSVKKPRVFSEEEKTNATKLAVVGMTPFDLNEFKFEELAGRIVSLNLATLKSDKAPAVEQMRSEIDKVLGNFATNLGGQDLTNLDDQTKEAMGLGNLEGYMIEAVLAKLGANPGKLDDRSVDYANGLGPAASLFGVDPNIPTEVKRDVKGGLSKARENFANYFKKFAFGGKADGPSFDEVRQKIIDKYPDIQFRISKRKGGFGYNLMGALKSKGGLFGDSGLNFQQPGNLKQLQEYSDNLASKLMNPQELAVGGLVDSPEKNFGKVALRTGSRIQATYIKEGEAAAARSGQVIADSIGNGLYAVQSSSATKGYGPKLYDIVMEAATAAGGMLTSDRRTVSDAAKNVWSYYFKNRSDVQKTPLGPENWVSNSRLLDEKLYGPPETWPAPTDPAWILQSGYSKAPSDINNPNLVQKLAKGGSVEDTVPALLTPGEFVINKKAAQKIGYGQLKKLNHADKMQGYNKGGVVGGVQAFMNGGVATPNERAASNITKIIQTLQVSGAATPEAINKLEEVVAKLLLETINSKDGILETAQVIKELRANSNKSTSDQISTLNNIVTAIKSTGDFQSAAAEKQTQAIESFLARTKGKPGTAIVGQFPPAQPPSGPDVLEQVEADRQKALENIAQAAFAAGKGLEEFITDLESFYTTVKDNQIAKMQDEVGGPLTLSQTRQAAVTATAATEQYGGVQLGDFLANDFENLSSVIKEEIAARQESTRAAAEATAEAQKQAEEYKNSGQAFKDFGTLGVAMPGRAQSFGQSGLGKKLLGEAQSFQRGPKALEGLNRVLDGLPGPVGNLVRSIGGLPGVVSVAASALGSDLLPQLGKVAGLSKSVGFAGLSGALAEGGSMAASLGTIGQQLAGPIAGMIGVIGGAVAGAINGAIKGVRTKTLENSLNALGKSSEEARKALEKLAKNDTAENAQKASRAVGNLQANVDDLGTQAQRTTRERVESGVGGAASGAAYGGIGATAFLLATAPAIASTAAAAASAVPALAGAASGILAVGTALAPLSAGATLAVAAGIVAVGAAIGAAYSYFSGPDELDNEALKGQLESISQYLEGINQLGQRRFNLTSTEDIGKFLNDLQNASTQAEKFAVASRGAFVEEAQRAAISRQLGPNAIRDNQSVQDVTAGNAQAEAIARVAEERYYETLALDELNKVYKGNVDVIREESKDKSKLIARGKELNLSQTESAAKQAALAKASLQATRALEGFTDIFKRINAGIKRFSEESTQYIADLESEVSTLLGDGKLQDVNRENERILANPAAYSVDEVRRAGAGVAGLAGGGADAQQIGNMAVASKLIEDRLPALLRGLSQDTEGGAGNVLAEIKDLFGAAGVDANSDAFKAVFSEISKSIEAVVGGGEGTSVDETALKDLVPQISRILESGREVALNIQKEYNDTIQRTIDLQNKANTLLLKANEYDRKAQQIRIQSNLDLQKAFGNVPTLEQMNQPFQTNITGLTEGLIPGGSMDPSEIARAVIESQQSISDREKALDQRRGAVGLLGAADTPAARAAAQQQIDANNTEQKSINEQIRKTNEATQALETLANSGELAANALSALQERQRKVAGYTSFIDKLLTSEPEDRAKITAQQRAANAVITGSATQGQFGNLQFRQEAMAGLSDLKDVLDPQEYRKILADFRIKSLEAAGVNVDRPSNLNGQSLRQLIEEGASGGAETPEAKAFQAAADTQSKAAAAMAEVNRVAAEKFMQGSDQLLNFFKSEFAGIVTKAFADVRGIEAEARTAATKPPEKPRELSPAEKALADAEKSAKASTSAAKRQTEERKAAEGSWTLSSGAKEIERRQEKDAIGVAAADQAEVQRLKAIVEAEQTARAAEESFRRSREELDKILAAAQQRQADMGAPAPSSRLGGAPPSVDLSAAPTIASATSEAAQQQNAAATNLNAASTSLTDSAQNLNSVTAGMRASGGTAGTTADIPGARATVAAATTVQNKEEIEQQLFLRLDEGTQRFLGEFNTSLATTFTTFGREFGNYITRLEQIKLPEKIEMTGRHTVDVRVTGAAGFDKLQDSMKNMIASAIKDKMSMIWNQSGGQYGERPA